MNVLRAFAFKTEFSYQAPTHGMAEQQIEMSYRFQLTEMCACKCFRFLRSVETDAFHRPRH